MNQIVNKDNTVSTVEQVTEYLQQNTDFFQHNPDVLLMMKLVDQPQGSISLVERQMQGLRQRSKELEKELQQVIRNAQDNQHLLQQTIDLSLKLIPCEDITSLADTLFQQLDDGFEIKYHSLILDNTVFADKTSLSVDMQAIRKQLGDNFPKQQPVCGRLKDSEKNALFAVTDVVNSAAILPLGEAGELGLLVLGSEDASHFDPEMGDLFLILIADMLSRLLYRCNK